MMTTEAAEPPPTSKAPRKRRRWLRYSLSTMLLLITGCAIGFGWLASEVSRARAEAQAVKQLKEVVNGGSVNVTFQDRFDREVAYRLPMFKPENNRWRAWIESTMGIDPFYTVTSLTIYGGGSFSYGMDDDGQMTVNASYVSGLEDEHAELLLSLPNLEFLMLDANPIGDEGTLQIARLKKLSSLRLGNTKVTDVGVARLATLRSLRYLKLDRTMITDAALDALVIRQLENLDLTATNVSEERRRLFETANPKCDVAH